MAKISSYPHTVPTTGDSILISKSSNKTTRSTTVGDVIDLIETGLLPGVGTVTSIRVTVPSAFTVTNSPVTSVGTIAITGAGTTNQYIDGTGSLQDSANQALDTTSNVTFSTITGDGAAITNIDKYTTAQVDGFLALKADQATTYTKTEADTLLALKADQATTYTKTEADSLFTSGFVGAITPTSTAPTQDGLYSCSTSGTYTNFGGEVVSLNNQVVSIAVENNQTTFTQIITPTGITFDSTPTAGSTNAVESGGVHSELSPLKEFVEELRELGVNIYNEDNFQEGRIDTTTGLIVDSSNAFHRTSGYISVLPNTIYTLSGRNSYKETAFYDINKNLLPSAGADYGLNIPAKNSTFTTPSNAHFFRMVVSITEPQLDDNIQLELGSSASVYEAFNINLKDYYNKTYIDS